jgi:hypothetical protein
MHFTAEGLNSLFHIGVWCDREEALMKCVLRVAFAKRSFSKTSSCNLILLEGLDQEGRRDKGSRADAWIESA